MATDRASAHRLPLLLVAVVAALMSLPPAPVQAQVGPAAQRLAVSDTTYQLGLTDGSTLIGRVTEATPDRIVVVTSSGVRIELDRGQIRSVEPVRGTVREGQVWPADPNRTRLLFGPTGRSLRRGEGYIGAFELFLPFLSYGLTDRLSLAGGTPILPGAIGRIFYLTPKLTLLERPAVQASTGVLAFLDFEEADSDIVGILYGAGTWGSADDALTAGVGWAFSGSDVTNRPAFLLGGEKRLSARVKLVTENYLVSYAETEYRYSPTEGETSIRRTEVAGILGGGVRIFGERLAGDLGLGLGVGDADFFCCVPLVNFVYNFGAR